MSTVTTKTCYCDRCGDEVVRRNALIIENMTFTVSGYDDRGSGGHSVKDKEFCVKCSTKFYEWFNRTSMRALQDPKP